jgi:hypothetical protein
MQMAMVSTAQKPTQRERFGEFLDDLPGSTKSVACVKRNVKNLGDPLGSCLLAVHWVVIHHSRDAGRLIETTSREADDLRESDQPTVLGDGNTAHTGKGLTEVRSLQRKHPIGHAGPN